jgi:hypothetical protein
VLAILLAKLLLAPACVVAVSLAGRRWGVAVAGLLGGLPVVAGTLLGLAALTRSPRQRPASPIHSRTNSPVPRDDA